MEEKEQNQKQFSTSWSELPQTTVILYFHVDVGKKQEKKLSSMEMDLYLEADEKSLSATFIPLSSSIQIRMSV